MCGVHLSIGCGGAAALVVVRRLGMGLAPVVLVTLPLGYILHKTEAFLSRPSGFYVARTAKRLRGTVWRLREDGESARFWLDWSAIPAKMPSDSVAL